MKKKYVFVVSCNHLPVMVFDNKEDAIKWCVELWADRMAYTITQAEMEKKED